LKCCDCYIFFASDTQIRLLIGCSCTAVRIPTSRAHSESIVALFDKPVDVAAARKALEEAPGVSLKDDPENLVRVYFELDHLCYLC
jgi:aspartate-semialdehyde dehydrogenase